MKLSTFEIDQNKAAAINELNTYLNRVVPQLIERAKQGYKVKADGKLFAKDSADFTAIYSKDKPKRVRFYIEWSKHSGLSFKTDRSYDLSDSNTYYVEFGYLDKYVNGEAVFKDLPTDKSAEKYQHLREELKRAKEALQVAESLYNSVKAQLNE